MKRLKSYLFAVLPVVIFITCLGLVSGCEGDRPLTEEEHKEYVEQWHRERIERLGEEQGWLKLAGLFWLEEDVHSFGSSSENDIVLPEGSIDAQAGTVRRNGREITFSPNEETDFTINGETLNGSITFHMENPLEFTHGRLTFTFIERDETVGLRLYDQQSEIYTGFAGIERFPVDLSYRVDATLIPHEEPTTIPIVNILGQTAENDTPGVLEFELKSETHRLWAISASGGDRLFLIVADETNRSSTFGGGRFLYVDNPGPLGTVTVDFNKLYNPPCAFSDYTTCPLPPPENRLNVAIEAGEKRY